MPEPLATVVIPCLNNAATLARTLDALDAQAIRQRLHVVVVDNGSSDGSRELAAGRADETLSATVRGSAAARNAGLARSDAAFMLSLDADCRPVPHWAERHLEVLASTGPEVLGSAGRSLPEPDADRWSQREDATPHPAFTGARPDYAVAGNACYRTALLRELGGFPAYAADDAALGAVARNRGLTFVWVPDAVVHHRNPAGWRGYARQMRKVGAYSAELTEPPSGRGRYYLGRARALAAAARPLARGRAHDALAVATRAVFQTLGSRATWASPDRPPPLDLSAPHHG